MVDISLVEKIVKDAGLDSALLSIFMGDIIKYFNTGIDSLETQLQINIERVNPRVLNAIKEYNFNLIKDMNDDLANKLKGTISRNLLTGDKKNMVKDIKDLFDTTLTRAKSIARTETARAYGLGELSAARQAVKDGLRVKKYWMSVIDNRTSPLCRRLNAKYSKDKAINVDDYFIDNESGWRGLTNPSHPNCRSSVVYIRG